MCSVFFSPKALCSGPLLPSCAGLSSVFWGPRVVCSCLIGGLGVESLWLWGQGSSRPGCLPEEPMGDEAAVLSRTSHCPLWTCAAQPETPCSTLPRDGRTCPLHGRGMELAAVLLCGQLESQTSCPSAALALPFQMAVCDCSAPFLRIRPFPVPAPGSLIPLFIIHGLFVFLQHFVPSFTANLLIS